jgi:hypothetical protein
MFLDSTDVKVYPTGYRKNSIGDVNSGMMTEKNLTYLKKLSENAKFNSYFKASKDVNSNTYTFDLDLEGYHFEFDLDPEDLKDTDLLVSDEIWAYIELKPKNINLTETTLLLSPIDESNNNNVLDVEDDNVMIFKGLGLVLGSALPSPLPTFRIQLFKTQLNNSIYEWVLCDNKNLKLQSNEISNDAEGNKNITEQFDTKVINIKEMIQLNGVNAGNNKLLGSKTINGVVTLVWVDEYNGTYEEIS